jgi:hypothetical protein
MRPSIRFLSIGLLGVAMGAYLLYRFIQSSARDPQGAATPQVRGELGALVERSEAAQLEISEIKTDIGRLQYQLSLLREQPSSNEPKSRSPEAERESDDAVVETPSKKGNLAYKEKMEAFESSFRTEPQDPGWSSSTLSAVREALDRDEALRAATLDLDCRSSLCRLELSDNGTDSMSASIGSMARKLMRVFPSIVGDRIDVGGKSTLVYYMLRKPYSPDPTKQ